MSANKKQLNVAIAGAGGGSSTPSEDRDSLQSHSYVGIIDLLGEGQIGGLVGKFGPTDKEKSILLNGTPLRSESSEINFEGVTWTERTGTQNQEYISGFGEIETPFPIGTQLKHSTPASFVITNPRVDEVRIILAIAALMHTESDGDIRGSKVEFDFSMAVNGGSYTSLGRRSISGKASSRYQRAYNMRLPKKAADGKPATRWAFQVRRLTLDSTTQKDSNDTFIDSYTEIVSKKLTYPNSALIATRFNAETFSAMPKREYLVDGLLIRVPNNYDPETRKYSGVWDGAFKLAPSSNPAWIMYDLLLSSRYGLGEYIDITMVDEARLYQIGQYCDQMVDDGFGKKEPRYSINCVINTRAEAYDLIMDISSVFNGMAYWAGNQVGFMIDAPSDPIMAFTPANIIGEFGYSGTSIKDRHSIVAVTWNDPEDNYKQAVEYVEDPDLIELYGVRKLDMQAFGCTSRGQAHRQGRWMLYTEHQQAETVMFKAGMDASTLMPGDIIQIQDPDRSGKRFGGRLVSCTARSATLDDAVDFGEFTGLKVAMLLEDGKFIERPIKTHTQSNIRVGSTSTVRKLTTITWETALEKMPVSQAVWVISAPQLELVQARVVGIKQGEDIDKVEITAVPHNPNKYLSIENDMMLEVPITSALNSRQQEAPAEVRIKQEVLNSQGIAKTRLVIDWDAAKNASQYDVQWKRDDGNWTQMPATASLSVEIEDVYQGIYVARVAAKSIFGAKSYFSYSVSADLKGKQGKPANVVSLTAKGLLFAMELNWIYSAGKDSISHVVLQQSVLSDHSDAAVVGNFAYPTTQHTINGLFGNQKIDYRIMVVDKSGNESDWSGWVSGITSADPAAMIDLISGHIGESALDGILTGKIDAIDSAAKKGIEDARAAATAIAKESKDRATAIATESKARADALVKEATDRANAISAAVSSESSTRAAALAKEASDRAAAVATEAKARTDGLTKEATDRANALTAQSTTLKADSAAKVKALKDEVDPKLTTLQNGITQVATDYKAGDTAVAGQLTAYKTSNDNAVASVLQKAESAVSTGATNSSAITAINSQITAINNTKLDASVISGYYTKGQTDDKAAEISAGKVEEFKATLGGSGANLFGYAMSTLMASSGTHGGAAYSVTRMLGQGVAGDDAYRIKAGSVSTGAYFYSGQNAWLSPSEPGAEFIVSLYIKSPVAKTVRIRQVGSNSSGSPALGSAMADFNLEPDVWTRISIKYTAARHHEYIGWCVYHNIDGAAVSDNNYVLISRPMAERTYGTTATPSNWVEGGGVSSAVNANAAAIQTVDSEVKRVDGLVTATSSAVTALTGRLSTVEGAVSTKADASAVNSLTTRVTNAENVNTSQGSAITSLENTVNHSTTGLASKASSTALTAVDNKVTQANGRIDATNSSVTNLAGRVSTVEGAVSTKAEAAALTSLTTRVTNAEGVNTSQGSAITSLENSVNHATTGLASKASSSALTAVDNKVTAANGRIDTTNSNVTTLTGRVSTVEGAVSTKADASALTALTTRMVSEEGKSTSQGNAITALENKVNHSTTGLSTKASTTALNSTNSEVSRVDGVVKGQANQLTQLASSIDTINGNLSNKADATAFNNLVTRVGNAEGGLQTQASNTTALEAKLNVSGKGGTNLLIKSNKFGSYNGAGYPHVVYQMGEDWEVGATYTLMFCVEHKRGTGDNNSTLSAYVGGGNQSVKGVVNTGGKRVETVTFVKSSAGTAKVVNFYMLQRPTADKESVGDVHWAVLVKGNVLTTDEWVPGPYEHVEDSTANATAISNTNAEVTRVDGRVTSTNADVTNLAGRIDTVEGAVSTKAEAAALTSLTTRVSNAEGINTSQGTAITTLQNSVNHATTGLSTKASSSALTAVDNKVTAVDGRVTATNSNVTALTGRVSTVEGQVSTKADVSAVNALGTRVGNVEGGLVTQANNTLALEANLIRESNAVSLAYDYEMKDPESWYYHNNAAAMRARFGQPATTGGGVVSATSFHLPEGLAGSFIYNKKQLTNDRKYKVSMWVRKTATATGPNYVTIGRSGKDGVWSIPGYTFQAFSFPANGNWQFVEVIVDQTANKAEYPYIYLGFSINNTNSAGWSEVQGFKVEAVLSNSDTDDTVASAAALTTTNAEVARVDGRVTTTSGQVTALSGRVSTVEGAVATKAEVAALNSLTTRVGNTESGLSTQATNTLALEAKMDSRTQAASLAFDYEMKNPDDWTSHYNYDLRSYFTLVADGKISNSVFRKPTTIGACWNYGRAVVPNTRKYKISMWVRCDSASLGACHFTAMWANGVNPAFSNARYTSLSAGTVPKTMVWTKLEKIWDLTSQAYELLRFGFAIGHSTAGGVWEMQGFNVEAILTNEDTDDSVASAAALTTTNAEVTRINGVVSTQTSQISTLQSNVVTTNNNVALKADQSVVTALTGRVTAAEDSITSTNSDIKALRSSIGGTAESIQANGSQMTLDTLDMPKANAFLATSAGSMTGSVIKLKGQVHTNVTTAKMLLDPTKLYKLRMRYRRTAGANNPIYIALINYNAAGTQTVTQNNTLNPAGMIINASIYPVGGETPALNTWREVEYYFKGKSTGASAGSGTLASPRTFPALAASADIGILANYNMGAALTNEYEIDYLVFEDATPEAANKLNADAIQTLNTEVSDVKGALSTQATSMTALTSSINTALDAITIDDTRGTNQPPSWYLSRYAKRRVNEFKTQTAIGAGGFFGGTYCNLETIVYYADLSGGDIIQTATSAVDPSLYVQRKSNGTAAWTAWAQPLKDIRDDIAGKASAAALTSLTTRVTNAEGVNTSQATALTNLNTTVGNQTTSISNVQSSVNGVRGVKAVTIDNNGVMSGYGLISDLVDGKVTSAFGINANSFYIGAPSSNKKPFIVTTTTTTINGRSYPAGTWIDAAYIANATIGTAHIADLAVTAAKIANLTVTGAKIANAAIDTAQIANAAITTAKIDDAQITTAKIKDLSVDTLKIQNDAVTVSSAASANGTTVSITVETSGGKVRIEGASYYEISSLQYNSVLNCVLYRNNVALYTWRIDSSGGAYLGSIESSSPFYWFYGDRALPIFVDTPPAGTHVYKVVADRSLRTSIGVMEVKK